MTLQVGLVGSDGIVLTSDRLVRQFENGSSSVSNMSKFAEGPGVLCCYSGDKIAQLAAYNVCKDLANDNQSPTDCLRAIGNRTIAKATTLYGQLPGAIRKVFVVFRDKLWLLELGDDGTSIANHVQDRAIAGDIANTCRYFANKYANNCQQSPVKELVRLASYVVLAASEENPYGIGGLEVFVVPNGKTPIRLAQEQEQELEKWFRKTARSIQRQLASPFAFASGKITAGY